MKLSLFIVMMVILCGLIGCNSSGNNANTKNQNTISNVVSQPQNSNINGQTQLAPSADTLTIALTRLRKEKQESVQPSEIFIKKDGVRLTLSVVEKGFVTIIYKGSDGDSQVLFPNKNYFNGKNEVEPNQNVVIPNKGWFFFDEKKGTETIYVVYSKQPPPKDLATNAKDNIAKFEKLRSENNNADSFATKDGELVRVVELKHE